MHFSDDEGSDSSPSEDNLEPTELLKIVQPKVEFSSTFKNSDTICPKFAKSKKLLKIPITRQKTVDLRQTSYPPIKSVNRIEIKKKNASLIKPSQVLYVSDTCTQTTPKEENLQEQGGCEIPQIKNYEKLQIRTKSTKPPKTQNFNKPWKINTPNFSDHKNKKSKPQTVLNIRETQNLIREIRRKMHKTKPLSIIGNNAIPVSRVQNRVNNSNIIVEYGKTNSKNFKNKLIGKSETKFLSKSFKEEFNNERKKINLSNEIFFVEPQKILNSYNTNIPISNRNNKYISLFSLLKNSLRRKIAEKIFSKINLSSTERHSTHLFSYPEKFSTKNAYK